MHKNKNLFGIAIVFIMIFMISLIGAVKPTISFTLDEGYEIQPTIKDYIRTGEDHDFEIHVFNISNGMPITEGISCYMHLYHVDGDHIYEGEDTTVEHNFDYGFDVDGGNFTSKGVYQAKFQCNDSILGGGIEIEFFVNNYGEKLTDANVLSHNNSMWFLMILFLLSLFGLFKIENPTGKLACYWISHLFFIAGTFSVWQFNSNFALSYIATAGVFKVLFYVSTIAVLPMIILTMVWIFYIHTMNDDIKKMMDRGMDEDEAYSRARSKR